VLLAGCGSSAFSPHSAEPANLAPLSSSNVNLIFVVSEDLAYNAEGDMNPTTANLQFIQRAVNALLAGYHGNNQPPPAWQSTDYDSIWTIKLDSVGNVTVSNGSCEGINSSLLPKTPPQF